MGLFQSSHTVLLLFLLACCLHRTTSQEDTTTATTAPSCNGAGSIATAVIVTFLVTVLLVVAGSVWWRRYKTKKDSNHLILETDPEKGRGEYAFDNPGFKDASLSVPTKQAFETGKNDLPKSKWQQWTPLSAFTVKSERRKALDDSVIEGNEIKVVSLKSHDFTGLGFNICGNMKEGIFVKDLLQRGPASESGKLNPGDRIHSVTINFEHMVYEDALTILGYASPYEVTVQATSGKLTSSSPDQGGQPSHPMYRSSSWSELYKVGKQSKRQLFGDDPNDLSSTYSSLQKSRSNVTTLERKDSKSPKPKQPRSKKPPEDAEPAQKHQKFGVKVLPLDHQQKSPKIAEQNENNLNIEKHQLDLGVASVDEVDDPKKPPPVKRREKKHQEEFQRNGSGIKRTEEGIPLELPPHLLSAASAALDVRGRRKGKAPAVPADEPNSDSDAEGDGSTIELNAVEVTVHQVEEEQVPSRKTMSAGDLRQVATLERAQSLEISERPLDDEVLHAPRLSLALDGLSTFERNRLKKSSDWGNLQDAVETESNVEVKNQIWPSFDSQNEPVIPKSGRPAVLVEEPVKKPPPTPEKPPVRRVINNRIDEPFEAARGYKLVAGGGDKFPPSWDLTKSTNSLEDEEKTVPNDETASKNEDSVDAIVVEQEETAAEEAKPTGSSQEVESLAPKSGTFVESFEADNDTTFNHPETINQKILDETASPSSPKVGNVTASAEAVEFPAAQNGITSEDSKTFNVLPGMNIKNQSTKIATLIETAANNSETVEFPAAKNGITSGDSKTLNVLPVMNIKSQSTKIATSTETAPNNSEAVEFPAAQNGITSGDSKTFNVLPGMDIKNESTKIATLTETAANNSEAVEFPAAKNGITSEDSNIFNVLPGMNIKNESTKTSTETALNNFEAVGNDTAFDKSVKNKKITNEPVAVDSVLLRKNVDNTLGSNEVINSYISMEFSAAENGRDFAVVNAIGSNGFAESSSPAVGAETETVIEVPHFPSEDDPVINNYFLKLPSHTVAEDAPVIEPSGEATTASIVLETTNKSPRTKSYTSFEIPMNESRPNRRQRLPDEPKPSTKPAEVLSKIPLLNSMVENQRRVGNLTDETKNIVTLNTVPDLLDLTQSFLQTEQLSSFSYGPHTNVPDDIKVSRHSKETSRHVSNVSVSNGNAELHSLELSINENKEVEESTSNPTYVTEIQVTTQAPTEENELAKIKEIAERQLKKLPEMRFTTSSYEPSRLPEKRHSTIEHLRSNFEKPKLTRQESSSSLKSRIPIATTAKTPPTSPERRDSRHIDVEHDQAILELMSRSVGTTPTKSQVKGSKNVTVTSIRSGSKIPSGLPTLGGGKSPPRRSDNGHESGFKQWVFNPSNVTNVVVTDDKRD